MTKLVDAIVRGPRPYFHTDGVLYSPGQLVTDVPADDVTNDRFREIEVEVEAKNGDLRMKKVQVPTTFLPAGKAPTAPVNVEISEMVTGDIARLNVSDFLKGGTDEIEAAIASGSVDSHLAAIEQAEVASKNRKAVGAAVTARNAAKGANPGYRK